ncbi:MAG TPA: TolC family protein [Kiritimatiellia bacterium]|nr:TolC family protein [Kiritimatiellia bacterium]
MNNFFKQSGVVLGFLLITAYAAPGQTNATQSLTLAECVAMALEHNLALQIEKLTSRSAQEDVRAALGGYDPQLTLSAQRAHTEIEGKPAEDDELLVGSGSDTDRDTYEAAIRGATALGGLSYEVGTKLGRNEGTRSGNPFDTSTGSAGVTLTQPLLKGFTTDATRYQVTLARKLSAEALVQLETAMANTIHDVEVAWFGLVQALESIAVQEEALRLATQLYEDNRNKVQIGAMSILDEKQAESQAAAARADLSAAKQAYAEAQNRLKLLIFADHRQTAATAIAPVGELVSEPVTTDVAASSAQALEQRPELRQARLALARQDVVVAYQRDQTRPALNLVGNAGVAANDERDSSGVFRQLESANEPYWSAGITLAIPLGNRAAQARHEQSRLTADKMKLQLRQLEEQVLVEVDNAVNAVAAGYERLQATRDARDYARQALLAEQRKLERGKSTSFVVLQLQRNLTAARNAAVQALMDYNKQCANLALAEGATLARYHITFAPPPPEK